jgi:hypothetical protein
MTDDTTSTRPPLTEFDPAGKATILSYNVPQPASYTGRNIIELPLEALAALGDIFKDAAFEVPDRTAPDDLDAAAIAKGLRIGDPKLFPNCQEALVPLPALVATQTEGDGGVKTRTTGVLRTVVNPEFADRIDRALAKQAEAQPGQEPVIEAAEAAVAGDDTAVLNEALAGAPAISDKSERPGLHEINVDVIAEQMKDGEKRLNIYKTLRGDYAFNFLPEPKVAKPRLLLVETYRLSSFLGSYGAGRTIQTFSLLPGERTKINIKTFRKTSAEEKSASSILDSFSKESADDFESSVSAEQSNKQTQNESFEYHVDVEASASWGWGSASVDAGVKGSTSSSREEFAKNTSSATNKHAQKASSKRDVQVNTSSEVRTEAGEETAIERELENINVSRTLNFVFRQMNQEFVSILHLVDVRVGFFNGFGEVAKEVTLPELRSMLKESVKDEKQDEVFDTIKDLLLHNIFDFNGDIPQSENGVPFVEERVFDDDTREPGYLRFRKDAISRYQDETGNDFVVPGIIVNVDKNVLRTDGVIVEALLGQANALDDYSIGLQEQAVKERELANERIQTGLEIAKDGPDKAADRFAKVFPRSVAESIDLDFSVNGERSGTGASKPT